MFTFHIQNLHFSPKTNWNKIHNQSSPQVNMETNINKQQKIFLVTWCWRPLLCDALYSPLESKKIKKNEENCSQEMKCEGQLLLIFQIPKFKFYEFKQKIVNIKYHKTTWYSVLFYFTWNVEYHRQKTILELWNYGSNCKFYTY